MPQISHPFGPLYNKESRVLILGSFPSVKSREQNFFYGHPQNRFWRVLAAILKENVPTSIEEKKTLLLSHHIALWDSLASCEIVGSADSSITHPIANDLSPIFHEADIRLLCFNGKKSEEIYQKFAPRHYEVPTICLPSTSPANAQFTLERLTEEWARVLRPVLECR
ncbi:MAG: DNA-deoxyinosine glycosylase [Clostridia bacterium]|nr:DNA-deoxyinosine glycosylase [Clostridia bacterium]